MYEQFKCYDGKQNTLLMASRILSMVIDTYRRSLLLSRTDRQHVRGQRGALQVYRGSHQNAQLQRGNHSHFVIVVVVVVVVFLHALTTIVVVRSNVSVAIRITTIRPPCATFSSLLVSPINCRYFYNHNNNNSRCSLSLSHTTIRS
jgi:hypothetical protein